MPTRSTEIEGKSRLIRIQFAYIVAAVIVVLASLASRLYRLQLPTFLAEYTSDTMWALSVGLHAKRASGRSRDEEEGESKDFKISDKGESRWSKPLAFLPDGWKHALSEFAGKDEGGRPMLENLLPMCSWRIRRNRW